MCIAENDPSPETEAYITHLANLLHNGLHTGDEHVRKSASSIRILDLCTGTGSIPLLLHSILSTHLPETHITGVDISPKALALARYNLRWNTTYNNLSPTASQQVTFLHADVLGSSSSTPKEHPVPNIHQALKTTHQPLEWDILISNPPYISTYSFQRTTSRSVRNHEPKSALVPSSSTHPRPNDDDGDVFYPPLLSIATSVHAKLVVLEVADMEQAQRVVGLAIDSGRWHGVGIWRDWPEDQAGDRETVVVQGRQVAVAGDGNGRVVLCWSREGGEWIGRP
ncbi:MAG: hypothetical protein M1833_001414 [Piccolia ochrophora]|nr:MAG: hypothetical protein M1833_001414 [Piccolia ochrophora]